MIKKGQVKIQEMAFVLVALILFFSIIFIFYFSLRTANLRDAVETERENAAREAVRKIASTPEFAWADCPGCVDYDKIMILKDRVSTKKEYKELWNLDYLAVEVVYPAQEVRECTIGNYPLCTTTTIIKNSENYGVASSTFVSLCHWNNKGYTECKLGRIYAAGKALNA